MKQILLALCHLYLNNIARRDIYPENILMDTNTFGDYGIKLNTFEASIYNLNPRAVSEVVGTPYYFSPEMLYKKYSKKSDIWGCGVILYVLLCGYPPFKGSIESEIEVAIEKGKIDFDSIE